MRILLMISFLGIMLTSCKKQDNNEITNTSTLTGKYTGDNTAIINPVVMYTKNKVITDATLIKKYLSSFPFAGIFNLTNTNEPANYVNFSIDATNSNNVLVNQSIINAGGTNTTYTDAYAAKITGNFNNYLLIQALKPDTTLIPPNVPIPPTNSIFVLPVAPQILYTSTGTKLLTTKAIPIVKMNNEFYYPLINSCYVQYTNSISTTSLVSIGYRGIAIIDPDLSSKLGDRDTVVAQQTLVKLIKQ